MRFVLVCAALLFSPAIARADVKADLDRIEAKLDKCTKADGSNAGMKECTWNAYQDADKLLNRAYQALSKAWLGGDSDAAERKKRLIAAQRAWIAFRDADCLLQATQMLGGSGESLVQNGCLYKATADRARQLEELMTQN